MDFEVLKDRFQVLGYVTSEEFATALQLVMAIDPRRVGAAPGQWLGDVDRRAAHHASPTGDEWLLHQPAATRALKSVIISSQMGR